MKRIITSLVTIILIISLSACGKNDNTKTPSTDDTPSTTIPNNTTPSEEPAEEDEHMNKTLTLTICTTEVDVYWMDNGSVKELKKLAENGLTIELHQYGGFEQVGSIGSTLPSTDTRITTSLGDICLYQSNQIVLFYGSNT